ncbi:ribosome maturation factor RimM [Amycolatopsis antarctica]|uniref:Ribosome maturation factor RimM n=1 Tax=Amycolatopsis antarctica TaxID=1854586 RepID=A0A263D9A4_9PSEU|nr:ribosome maturation factor RimM [Amycolatopsis antarctica]OZM74127.1 ribosome maturation factor RimM [Amycolatopsis antarctica]
MADTQGTEVVVGRIAKAHGVGGELAVDIRTDSPELRFALGSTLRTRLRDGSDRELTVAAARSHSGRLLVRFEQVLTRDVAETLRGALLLADTADLPPTGDPDEFYDHELEGLRAELADGTVVGIVIEMVHSPGAELLSIDREGVTVLVPFVRAIVPEVDIAGGRVVLTPPDGLLDGE